MVGIIGSNIGLSFDSLAGARVLGPKRMICEMNYWNWKFLVKRREIYDLYIIEADNLTKDLQHHVLHYKQILQTWRFLNYETVMLKGIETGSFVKLSGEVLVIPTSWELLFNKTFNHCLAFSVFISLLLLNQSHNFRFWLQLPKHCIYNAALN